ncbi:MAG: hypothetical protein LBH05_06610 [Deferribacteraceae bacterium]|nr:hypothetical protein [Deferribacteraceae bacterium]
MKSKINLSAPYIAVPLYINRLCELNVFYEARQSMQVKALTGLPRRM